MKKIFKHLSEKLELQIIIFVMLLPFIDIYDFFIGSSVQFLGISVIELFKISIVNYLLILVIISKKSKIISLWYKYKKVICLVLIIFLLYIFVHVLNVSNFNSNILSNTMDKNVLVELYYIYRTYFISLIIFFIIMMSDINKEKIIKLISIICFIMSIIIVVSNIFQVSYIAYSSYLEEDTLISGNIFSWFSDLNVTNADLYTSKGFFFSANQLSVILFSSFMISVLNFVISNKWYLYFTLFIKALALLMLSTKVCGIGLFLILIIYIILILFFRIFKKQKIEKTKLCYLILIFFSFMCLFFYSPLRYKIEVLNNNLTKNESPKKDTFASNIQETTVIKNSNNVFKQYEQSESEKAYAMDLVSLANIEELNEYEKDAFIIKLIEKRGSLGIHLSYMEEYPIEDNLNFWKKVVLLPQSDRINFRKFKSYWYKDVLQKNDNIFFDKLFGIGYVSGFPYLESDFLGQDIWFGKIGTFYFVWIYVIFYIVISIKFLRSIYKNLNMENCILCICLGIVFIISYIAGHTFGNIFPMTILILILKAYSYVGNEVK
jgi:hypothetical protein